MPFFKGTDPEFLASLPPSARRYDWKTNKFTSRRGQRGFKSLTFGIGAPYPSQSWRWKTWVAYGGHRYTVWVEAVRNADAAPGSPHLKYYGWCHNIRRDHPMYEALQTAMVDMGRFQGGCQPSVGAVRDVFLAHIKAAVDGGRHGYMTFIEQQKGG